MLRVDVKIMLNIKHSFCVDVNVAALLFTILMCCTVCRRNHL